MAQAIFFDCGPTGNIIAAQGITFKPVKSSKIPVEHGSAVVAEARGGEIDVSVDTDNHLTSLTFRSTSTPDPKKAKLLIRAPIGVRIYQITPARTGSAEELFHETGPGYNTLPKYLGPNLDGVHGQTVQELVLITGHVPPRIDPSTLSPSDFGTFQMLSPDALAVRLAQDDGD